jgi:hypothetical protein
MTWYDVADVEQNARPQVGVAIFLVAARHWCCYRFRLLMKSGIEDQVRTPFRNCALSTKMLVCCSIARVAKGGHGLMTQDEYSAWRDEKKCKRLERQLCVGRMT